MRHNPINPESGEATAREKFDNRYPPGLIALRKAFSLQGNIGRWLIQQPLALKVNDKVYMHGGIASSVSEDSINSRAKTELRNFLNATQTLRAAGVMPWYVDYNDRLSFLNARAEEFKAGQPDKRCGWV
ncbi:MAG: hypothetical protein ACJAUG_002709 [Halioglobus sp.]